MHNFIEHRTSYFSKYSDKMQFRFATFKTALNILIQRTESNRIIVETGSQSTRDNWAAGCSTTLFGEFCLNYGGVIHTVDINPNVIEDCKKVTENFEELIEYHAGDSVSFLESFKDKIDLLYLDSYDYPIGIKDGKIVLVGDPLPSQIHILNETKAAMKTLKDSSIILIDDSNCPGGGKGGLAIPFLEKKGWMILFDLQQTILIKQ